MLNIHRIGIENFVVDDSGFYVCVCDNWRKTEKENNTTRFFFVLFDVKAVEMCAKSLLDAFNCMAWNMYTMIRAICIRQHMRACFVLFSTVMLGFVSFFIFWHIFSIAYALAPHFLSLQLRKTSGSQTVATRVPHWKQRIARFNALPCTVFNKYNTCLRNIVRSMLIPVNYGLILDHTAAAIRLSVPFQESNWLCVKITHLLTLEFMPSITCLFSTIPLDFGLTVNADIKTNLNFSWLQAVLSEF